MSLENARQFVAAMREDETRRHAARAAATNENLAAFFEDHGHSFDMPQLVVAMVECMDEMASAMPG